MTGDIGTSGLPQLPICKLAVLMTELISFALQSLNSPAGAEYLDFVKYLPSFCRVGFRLLAMEMSERREFRLVVEAGDNESSLDIGLMGYWKDILAALVYELAVTQAKERNGRGREMCSTSVVQLMRANSPNVNKRKEYAADGCTVHKGK